MKKILYGKKRLFVFILVLILPLFMTCEEQPVGLGAAVDADSPLPSIVSHNNDDFVSGTFVLEGSIVEDTEISKITVVIDDQSLAVSDFGLKAGTSDVYEFSLTINTTDFTDGSKNILVQAEDKYDKTGSVNILLNFDNTAPLVIVNKPEILTGLNGSVLLKGDAADNFSISEVRITMEDSVGTKIIDAQPAIGYSSWYYSINSINLGGIVLDGDYDIIIEAEDPAGNVSTDFFRLVDLNNSSTDAKSATIDQLYLIYNGSSVSGITVTQNQLAALAISDLTLGIDQDADLPQILIISPSPSDSLVDNALTNKSIANGQILDDDGVDISEIYIAFDLDPSDTAALNDISNWTQITDVRSSGTWYYPLTTVLEGIHTMNIRAADIYGAVSIFSVQTGSVVDFSIDSGSPIVTMASPAVNSKWNSDVLITGTAIDGSGIAELRITVEGETPVVVTVDPDSSGDGDFTYSFDVNEASHGDDGAKTITIEAEDMGGKITTVEIPVTVDTEDPDLTLLSPAVMSFVNGEATIQGSTSDALTQIQSLDIQFNSDGWLLGVANFNAGSTKYNWSKTFDTTGFPDLTDLDISIRATDAAGNAITEIYTLQVDQSKDLPVIELRDFSDGKVVSDSSKIYGTVFDDDAVNPNSITISIDGGAPALVTRTETGVTEVSWEFPFTGLAQGNHTLTVYAEDAAGASSNTGIVNFNVDKGPPVLTVNNFATLNNSHTNSNIALTGMATDGLSIAEVRVYTDENQDGVFTDVTEESVVTDTAGGTWATWSSTIDITGLDGTYDFLVQAEDSAGNTTDKYLYMTIDTTFPVVALTYPLEADPVNGTIDISGTITEDYINSVQYQINGGGFTAPVKTADWKRLGIDTTAYSNAAGDGTLTLDVRVIDKAGNPTTETFVYTINQRTDRPVISFSNLDEAPGDPKDNTLDANPVLVGTVSDDDAVLNDIEVRINGGAWEPATGQPTSSLPIVSWSHELNGYAEGLYSIEVRAVDSGITHASLDNADPATEDLNYQNSFKASLTASVPFIIDSGPPSLDITGPASNTYHNGNFTLTGTASDSLGVDTVTVFIDRNMDNDFADAGEVVTATDLSGGGDWSSWNYALNIGGISDGALKIRVSATDLSGKTSYTDVQYLLDRVAPTVEFVKPETGQILNGMVQIKGTASDENQVDFVEIRIDDGEAVPVVPVDWTNPDGVYSWDYWWNSRPSGSDTWTVYARATDKAGNTTAVPVELVFDTDQTTDNPVVTFTNITAGGTARDNLLGMGLESITGTVTDDDGVNISSLRVHIDGNASGVVPTSTSGSGRSYSFEYDISGLAESSTAHTVSISVSDTGDPGDPDVPGNDIGPVSTATAATNFAIDRNLPVVEATDYTAGSVTVSGSDEIPGSYLNSGFILEGTASDTVEVAEVRLKVNGATNVAADTSGGGDWSTWEFDTDDFAGLLTGVTDGVLTVSVTVEDFFGRTSSRDIQLIVDTTPPTVNADDITPTEMAAVNGAIQIRGSSSDNEKVARLELSTGGAIVAVMNTLNIADPDGSFEDGSTASSWKKNINISTYANGTYGTRPTPDGTAANFASLPATETTGAYYLVGGASWYLFDGSMWVPANPWIIPFDVEATDAAGNVGTVATRTLFYDSATDYPVITLNNLATDPTASVPVFSGVNIQGTVTDDDGVDTSSIEVSFNGTDWFGATVTGSGKTVTFTYPVPNTEGANVVYVRADDLASAKALGTFTPASIQQALPSVGFYVDKGAPVVALTRLQSSLVDKTSNFQGTYFNENFTISGTAVEGNTLDTFTVEYFDTTDADPGNHDWTDPGVAVVSDTGDYDTWHIDMPIGAMAGEMQIRFIATDNFGKPTTLNFTAFIDQDDPVIALSSPDVASELNGIFDITGTATEDTSQISTVEYSFDGTGVWNDITANGKVSWEIPNLDSLDFGQFTRGTVAAVGLLPSSGNTAGDFYTVDTGATVSYYKWSGSAWNVISREDRWDVPLNIRVTDVAGNIGSATYALIIDQKSDRPVISLSNMDPAPAVPGDNLLELNPKIIGSLEDDDGIDGLGDSLVEVSFDYDGTNEAVATWTEVGSYNGGLNFSWSHNLFDGVGALIPAVSEGNNTFAIRVRDADWTDTEDGNNFNKTIVGPVDFAIDQSAPEIVLSGGSVTGGDYINATGGNIIFDVTEPNLTDPLTESKVLVNGAITGITDNGGNNFSFAIDTGALTEGVENFTISVTDDFDKTTEYSLSVTYDNTAPIISVTNLSDGDVLNGNIFTLSGAVNEPFGINGDVNIVINDGSSDVVIDTVTGTYTWTYDIDMDSVIAGDDTGLLDSDTYTITLSAVDMAGNPVSYSDISFDINQSLDYPQGEITNLGGMDSDFQTAIVTVSHTEGKDILMGVLYADSAIVTGNVVLTINGQDKSADVVYQGSGTIIPFYLDMTDESAFPTGYPDAIYNIGLTADAGVTALYDIVGNKITTLDTGSRILGLVTDDDNISSIVLDVDGITVLNAPGINAKSYNLNHTVTAAVGAGIHLATLTVTDVNGVEDTINSIFTKDGGDPVITVTTPVQGAYVNDSVSTSGSVIDDFALKSLSIKAFEVDSTLAFDFDTTQTYTHTDEKNWSWDFVMDDLPDTYSSESITLEYTAQDFVGNSAVKERAITVDNIDPTAAFSSPAPAEKVNGAVTIRGTATDDAIDTVQIVLGGGAPMTPVGTYNWYLDIPNIVNYANRDYATEQFTIHGTYADAATLLASSPNIGEVYYLLDSKSTVEYTAGGIVPYYDLWHMEMEILVTDKAGNTQAAPITQTLQIDANTDRPKVEIVQPVLATSTKGGTILVFGTALDDDGLDRIEARVDVNGDGDFDDQIDLYDGSSSTFDADTDDPFEDETVWYSANGTESWTIELNNYGELYQRGDNAGDGGLTGTITIEVRAVDVNGLEGLAETRVVTLDNTVPVIGNQSHLTGDYENGTFNLTADITDDASGGIENVSVNYTNGSGSWYTLYDLSDVIQDASITVNSSTDFDLNLPVETTTLGQPEYISDSGVLYLVLKVTDTNNYQTLSYIYLNIDNEAPSANLKLDDPEIFNPYDITDAASRVYGHASDLGTVNGLSRVLVYFSSGTTVYDVYGDNELTVADAADWTSVLALNDDTPGSEKRYVLVIDDMDEYGTDDTDGDVLADDDEDDPGDGDLINEYITAAAGGTDWWVEFDSTTLPDGDITLRFVVEDNAGNVSTYSQPAIIANNKPNFTTTLVGDDLDLDGAVATAEQFNLPVSGNNIKIIERLKVDVTTDSNCTFDLFYGDLSNNITPTSESSGAQSYSFTLNKAAITGYGVGTHTFIIEATDTATTVRSFKEIKVDVVASDGAAPEMQIFPFTAEYTDNWDDATIAEPLSNLNIDNQVLPALVDPTDLTDGVYQGHIQFVADSVNGDTVGSEDADISGIITFSGYIYDNRGIMYLSGDMGTSFTPGVSVNADYDIYNVGNESNILAYWNRSTKTFTSQLPEASFGTNHESFTIVSAADGYPLNAVDENLGVDGHILYWTYKIDTNYINNVADEDIVFALTAVDFYNQPSVNEATAFDSDIDAKVQFDVVPYITGLTNPTAQNGLSSNNIRSALGRFIIDRQTAAPANQFQISGYNLGGTGGTLVMSSDPNIAAVGAGTDISGQRTAGTNLLLTMRKNIAQSGYLTIFVNGTASINNYYDAVDPTWAETEYNKEEVANVTRTSLWTNDRYLTVWQTTQVLSAVTNQTFYYPSMIMSGDQPLFSYTNDNNGSVRRTTGDDTSQRLGALWYERQTSIATDDNGNYWVLSVQDAYSGGDIGYLYLNRDNQIGSPYGNTNRNNSIELVGEDYGSRQLNRFRYPKLFASGPAGDTQMYVAFYDEESTNRDIKIMGFRATSATAASVAQPGGDNGIMNAYDSVAAAGHGSEFYDMIVLGDPIDNGTGNRLDHYVVLVYYDPSDTSLRLKYALNPVDANGDLSGTPTWNEIVLELPDAMAGSYVSMTADATNVYVAYHDSNNVSLKLSVLPLSAITGSVTWQSAADGAAPYSTYYIDVNQSVGTWTNVDIVNSLPVISYYANSFSGTKESIRYAYPQTTIAALDDGANLDGTFTGNWEIQTVPAESVPLGGMPQFNRTQLGSYASGALPVVGWLADRIEYSKMLAE